ncbi:LysM peptidoglycan-binding domain-containing protein [Haliea sp. E17]|uniref:lytic transglycosylase domain-containing protein n=1 Tax=Haliea sp. E17 TaxID=3401576 RepID=UPI003AAE360E
MNRGLIFFALLLLSLSARASDFPRPASLEPAVQFWTRVYTEVSTNQGFVHDARHLAVVYETLDLPVYGSNAQRQKVQDAAKARIVSALNALARGKREHLDATETRVLAAWPAGTSNATLREAAQNVRFQLGQSDRFREGLVRAGQWKPYIRQVLADQGLPAELDVLPHVESSFNPAAWSRVAAAGMWQFMPATARQFMRVDHVVDQRMDPFTSTEGAARLLKRNYAVTGTWPLALTGYNHGAAGMVRATKAVGSNDIGKIIATYNGPAFGFASRNFYPSFLAALDVDRQAERFFPGLKPQAPVDYEVVTLSEYIPASALAQGAGISVADLQLHNPALREPIWKGDKYLPRGYPLRLPRGQLPKSLDSYLAAIPSQQRFSNQKPDRTHRIAPGDSLWLIARRYNTSVDRLKALNGMRGDNLRVGKTLILPGSLVAEPAIATLTRQPSAPRVYTIRKGDSLWSIAKRFQVSHEQLAAWNGLSEKHYLHPGQTLRVAAMDNTQR